MINTRRTLLTSRFLFYLGIPIACVTLFGVAGKYPTAAQNFQPGGAQDREISLQEQAQCLPFGGARMSLQTGIVRFIGTEFWRPIPHPRPLEAATPEAAARAYFSVCGPIFGLQDQANELMVTGNELVDARRTVVRFRQLQHGVPIIGAELIIHLDNAKNIVAVTAKTL